MSPSDAFIELIDRIGSAQGDDIFINQSEINLWPEEAVIALKKQKLILKAKPSTSVVCSGCEEECTMPVYFEYYPDLFTVCDKREDVNKVFVSPESVVQWKCSMKAICDFIANSLSIKRSNGKPMHVPCCEIGMAMGNTRCQMLCLELNETVELKAGHNKIPLIEFIVYQNGRFLVDNAKLSKLIDLSETADERYTPSIAMREARKKDTNELHKRWNTEYQKLKKAYPNRSKSWYAQKISKMDIKPNREPGTILRKLI